MISSGNALQGKPLWKEVTQEKVKREKGREQGHDLRPSLAWSDARRQGMCMGLWGVGNSGTLTAQKLRWLTSGPQNHSVINWGLWPGEGGEGKAASTGWGPVSGDGRSYELLTVKAVGVHPCAQGEAEVRHFELWSFQISGPKSLMKHC